MVKKFREGGYNTLVSTCVGEEGLDIGEVDLIINYDAQKNPIRLIQRMGRTGRKREGRIIILLTEGKEESSYLTSLSKKKNMYKHILQGSKNFQFYSNNPLMIPKGIKPKCHQMFITVQKEEETKKVITKKEKEAEESKRGRPKKPKDTKETKASSKYKINTSFGMDLPDLDFEIEKTSKQSTLDFTKMSKSFKETNHPKLQSPKVPAKRNNTFLNDCSFLDQSMRKISSNSSNALIVPEPLASSKRLVKTVGKKTFGKNEEIDQAELHDLIQEWQSEEDDFLNLGEGDLMSKQAPMDLISLRSKFESLYMQLVDDLSPDEEEDEKVTEFDNKEEYVFQTIMPNLFNESNKLPDISMNEDKENNFIVDETIMDHDPHPAPSEPKFQRFETSLNELFSDSDELHPENEPQNIIVDETMAFSSLAEEKSNQDQDLLDEVLEFINETVPSEEMTKAENKWISEIGGASSVSVKNSTPMRSILKKPVLSKFSSEKGKYSPLPSPLVITSKCTPIRNQDASCVGMTQALELLKSTILESPEELFPDVKPLAACFDMKTTLHELFTDEESIQFEDVTSKNNDSSRGSHRKLRFDETSIKQTRKGLVDEDENSIMELKRNNHKKILSSSSEEENLMRKSKTSNSIQFEDFLEVIGNNEAQTSESEESSRKSTEDSEHDSELVVKRSKKVFYLNHGYIRVHK